MAYEPLTCAMCGKLLLVDEDTRYVVEIAVYAAYDPLEITPEDLAQDHRLKIKRILEGIKGKSAQELEDEVAKLFRFHLCPACQKVYIKNPLPRRS